MTDRHNQRGYTSLADLQQSPPIDDIAISTGWWELDQIWRLYPGQFTIVTGIPGHGKSTLLLNLVANLADMHGTKSFLYVPEDEQHLKAKMRRIWGERLGFENFCREQCFVQTSTPEDFSSEPQDLPWVLNRATAAIENDLCSVLLIDPWNELEFAKHNSMSMTDYIRQCLMYLKQFCRSRNVAVILVAHPTKAVTENGGRTPLLSDVEGSMHWYNKCDNGLIVVREFTTKTAKVISSKARVRGSGKIGVCHFFVDEDSERFTPQKGAVSL